jgi:hypothetical protein
MGVAATALIAPAAAEAGSLALPAQCAIEGARVPLGGAGWTPNRLVNLSYGDRQTSALADAAGNLGDGNDFIFVPFSDKANFVRDYTITAVDSANPANTATLPFKGVEFGVEVTPRRGRPGTQSTFRIGGFAPGREVFAHYVFRGRRRKTVSMGTAKAPCGTITTRRRQLPTRVRYGLWKIQVDQSQSYSRSTTPRSELSLLIFRRFRRR